MAEKNTVSTFGEGQFLFKQGDQGGELYVIKSGEVELTVIDIHSGEQVIVAVVTAPTVLGTMTFLEGDKRSATARAKSTVTCTVVNQEQRQELLKQTPPWLKSLLKDMSSNLRALNSKYSKLTKEYEALKQEHETLQKRVEYQRKYLEQSTASNK
ncbi:MAG: Crp/Fnr family transcriptional regulator [Bacteriovoracaceae bacterium]|nr:Crp/Fnr family transcriptional regulator [Bacteriovoracaceae bacterium]